jgi:hypothetical protein
MPVPAKAIAPGSGTITTKNGASHQIWAICELTQIWWLAPFSRDVN